MGWTDERVELLKRLWTEGLSASQIAERLGGGVSRNAVIGKVHRLKLESRIKTPSTAETAAEEVVEVVAQEDVEVEVEVVVAQRLVPPPQPTLVQSRPMPRLVGATALKMEPEEEDVMEMEPVVERRPGGSVVPIARRLSLTQLNERTCKWPVGDPLRSDFHFCGHRSKDTSPYCDYHARIAFQPVSERRRVR
ncbi:GcrA family cell cycle regulator [Aurantimonas sp. Leaf443]|uniref:GcrA family cell cycle regulator n=1 Tax=Aurantimonas sp. Leaf443 TaxID=1736378 RepID=UPI0006F7248B|nr:GcrA family cell cycle regulator [Aurantimonas sp. Leaf443]KQT88123.1 GcrA cell cycle regulator [Aurantimonas sp. Leaf443]